MNEQTAFCAFFLGMVVCIYATKAWDLWLYHLREMAAAKHPETKPEYDPEEADRR